KDRISKSSSRRPDTSLLRHGDGRAGGSMDREKGHSAAALLNGSITRLERIIGIGAGLEGPQVTIGIGKGTHPPAPALVLRGRNGLGPRRRGAPKQLIDVVAGDGEQDRGWLARRFRRLNVLAQHRVG